MVTGKAAKILQEGPASGMRSISILGATGSIGASTVDLIKRNRDRYRVETVAAGRNPRFAEADSECRTSGRSMNDSMTRG